MTFSRRAAALYWALVSGGGCGAATPAPQPAPPPTAKRPNSKPTEAERHAFVVPARCAREGRPLACLLSDGLPFDEKLTSGDATRAMTDAVTGLNRRCGENDQDACARAASLLLVFTEISSKENAAEKSATAKKGVEILRTACELGASPLGCYVLATLTLEGHYVTKDASRAAGYFARSCDETLAAGCYAAGEMQEDAEVSHPDVAEAFRFMARGCELGNSFACTHKASRSPQGEGRASIARRLPRSFRARATAATRTAARASARCSCKAKASRRTSRAAASSFGRHAHMAARGRAHGRPSSPEPRAATRRSGILGRGAGGPWRVLRQRRAPLGRRCVTARASSATTTA